MAGDCKWSTYQVLLGWVIDTVNTTLSLPPHREKRFKKILMGIPQIQKCISVNKWNWVLGNLCSMTIDLPGAKGLFSHMK